MRSRGGRSRGAWRGGRIVRLLAGVAGALFLAWWAVKVAVVNAMARTNPFVAARIAPDHPASAIEVAMLELALRNGRIAPGDRARALHALDRAALAEEPFLVAALSAAAGGQSARSEALLAEARRRNPRDRLVRLLLLDRYLRTGRSAEAGGELAVVLRLVPAASAALVPQMTQLAADPRTRHGLSALLSRNPDLRDDVLARLASSGADPDLVLALAAESGSGRDPEKPPVWQGRLLRHLIDEGHVGRAYQVWRASLGAAAPAAEKGLYDGAFRGAPGAPPFNWELLSNADGTAERNPAPALQVNYYGRNNTVLARQLLMLKPGSYQIRFRADGAAKGDGARLQWSVSCPGSPAPLVQVPLVNIASAPRTLSAGFTVPGAGCPAQWLRLEGVAGDVASEQDVRISDLELIPQGAGRAR